ncbi:hypothetical protein BC936DRAFT_141402 [Jimgerdemannia flammicorona]|uniref:PDEase domain-containing protein n=1 Tax=Jimgerdemannia flammicorona TaxID=994334 RepID=A0A433A2B1_9FUNG|nr:hypothetical protein BC936DRAFT_141402 [Jimgerdemannia flammicorona]
MAVPRCLTSLHATLYIHERNSLSATFVYLSHCHKKRLPIHLHRNFIQRRKNHTTTTITTITITTTTITTTTITTPTITTTTITTTTITTTTAFHINIFAMAPTLSRLLNFLTFFLTVLTCLQHASVNGVAEPASSSGSAWRIWVWALYVVSLITLLSWWPMKTNHVVLSSLSLSGLFVAFLAATSPLSIVVQLSYVARTCIFSVFGAMSRLSADTTTIEPRRVIDDVKIAVEVPFAAPAMERMNRLISDLHTRPARKSIYRGFCIDPRAVVAPSTPGNACRPALASASPTEHHLPRTIPACEHGLVREILRFANGWNFPIFRFVEVTHNHPLLVLSLHLFEQEGFFERFGIDVEKFATVPILLVSFKYHYFNDDVAWEYVAKSKQFTADINLVPLQITTVSTQLMSYKVSVVLIILSRFMITTKLAMILTLYHRITYGAITASNAILRLSGLRQYLTDLDVLAILFGAIIHDIGHPGVKSDFLIKVGATEALMFNGRNVLENYHLSLAFGLLDHPENNFLENLRREDFIYFNRVVVEMVLATDLVGHDDFLEKFKRRFQPLNGEKVVLSPSVLVKPEDRLTLMQMVVKLADVSTPTKELPTFMRWSKNCLEEFVIQAELEKELGLPFAWYMDKEQMRVPSEQIGFIKRFVMPLWETFDTLVPIPAPMAALRNNLAFWEHRKSLGERAGLREEDFRL